MITYAVTKPVMYKRSLIGNITWYGDLVDDYGQETNGYATLTSHGGKVIGNFALEFMSVQLQVKKD